MDIYISARMVDELCAGVEEPVLRRLLTRVAGEIGVTLGVVTARFTIREGDAPAPETLQARLRVAIAYLEDTRSIGTIAEPEGYFCGALGMSYDAYQVDAPPQFLKEANTFRFAYFAGAVDDTTVALIGSQQHFLGARVESQTLAPSVFAQALSPSAFPYDVLQAVEKARDTEHLDLAGEQQVQSNIAFLSEYIMHRTPAKRVEFLAVRHFDSGPRNPRFLLGSPLYVRLSAL